MVWIAGIAEMVWIVGESEKTGEGRKVEVLAGVTGKRDVGED